MIQTTSAGSPPRTTDRGMAILIVGVMLIGILIGALWSAGMARLQGTPEEFAVTTAMIPEYFMAPADTPLAPYHFERGEHRLYYLYNTGSANPNPDVTCTVTDASTGAAIPIEQVDTFTTVNSSVYQGAAIGGFTIPQSGTYSLQCGYANGASQPKVEMMVGQVSGLVRLAAAIRPMLPMLAWVLPVGFAAVVSMMLWLWEKRRRFTQTAGRV